MAPQLLSAEEASKLILSGKAPAGITVEQDVVNLTSSQIKTLPEKLTCYELDATASLKLETIPKSLQVECGLILRKCASLESLPKNLTVGTLDVSECPQLVSLPEGLDVWFLRARQSRSLLRFPKQATIRHGGIDVAGCENLLELPEYLTDLATLDISDCPRIDRLPATLRVRQWIDLADSGLKEPCPQIERCQLRWRGVPVTEQIAFRPETITARQCIAEKNAEVRRVMIERMTFDKFVREAGGKAIDQDTDPGGKRELIRVPLEDDEDVVCLSCFCPSTERHYLLRVPPTIKSCHAAAAWMAGFDDPKKYKPLIET